MQAAKKPILALSGLLCLTGACILYLFWSKLAVRSELMETDALTDSLRKELHQLISAHEKLEREHASGLQEIDDLRMEQQTLMDRAANLTAQRDHLRADIEKRTRQLTELSSHVTHVESELSAAQHRILELEQLPDELESKLATAEKHTAAHEAEVDRLAALLAETPEVFTFNGTSEDAKVFALTSVREVQWSMPRKVLLCNAQGLVLDGWIHKSLEGHLIGHAGKWHQSASALVKGEKVFMLPSKSHEMHH